MGKECPSIHIQIYPHFLSETSEHMECYGILYREVYAKSRFSSIRCGIYYIWSCNVTYHSLKDKSTYRKLHLFEIYFSVINIDEMAKKNNF